MTKAEQIRKLYAEGKSDAEIAKIVGCHSAYVRVAIARKRSGGLRSCDRAYARMLGDLAKQYGCRQTAREAYRSAYRHERRAGNSCSTAEAKASTAYTQAMRKTALAKFCNQ